MVVVVIADAEVAGVVVSVVMCSDLASMHLRHLSA